MTAGAVRDALGLVLGVVSGIMAGAFGVGGAIVTTPGVRVLGASAFLAVGTTLPPTVVSAAVGTGRYTRERLVDWPTLAAAAPVGALGAVGGSLLSHEIPGGGHWLMVVTAAMLAFSAIRLVQQRDRPPRDAEAVDPLLPLPPWAAAAGVGVAAGLLSGLLGVGGGLVLVPGFTEVVRLPLKRGIATSLACVGMLAIPGSIVHSFLGDVDWRLAAVLAVGVVPGALLGAAAAIRARDRRLRLIVGIALGAIAVVYGIAELAAL